MAGSDLERRIVSVLFCDLVGFTSLSESMDAEDVSIVQAGYFAGVKDAVARYGGVVEKFIGDAAVGVFGVPVARDDDAERAVRCGFAIVGAVEQLCALLSLEPGTLQVRVGVNTGEAVVHPDPAPGEAMVTGDTVNTAARLQSAAPPGGVLIGPTSALAVAEAIELEDAGELELKGKAEPLRASLATSLLPERSREAAMGDLRAPMLGRDDELAALRDALAATHGGTPARWLVVVAPPGTGKTRLTASFAIDARGAGALVRSVRLRSDVVGPYDAVAQLLVSALSSAGVDLDASDRRDAAEAILVQRLSATGASPARADVVVAEALNVSWPPTEVPTGGGDRDARFAAWLEALDALADGDLDLWILEDLHWSSPDLLAFLDAATSTGARRLVIATTRPSLLETASSWCAAGEVLHLAQLAPTDARALVRALVGGAIPEGLVEQIVARSDGNPLFIEELLRSWVSVGALERSDDRWVLASPVDEVRLPQTVQSIYAAQLDDLSPPERVVARRASVAGRRFPVAALARLDVPEPGPPVASLARRALLLGPEVDAFSGETYAYRHALLRDAGYASLARAERARLHVRLARWIEEVAGERWSPVAEVIAGHYAEAFASAPALAAEVDGLGREVLRRLAADWFHRAGRVALTLSAFDTARALLQRSIELTPDEHPVDLAVRLTVLGRATASAADANEAAELHRRAMAVARDAMVDPGRGVEDRAAARAAYATAAAALGEVYGQQVRFDDMLALAEEVLAEIGDEGPADLAVARTLVLRARARGLISEVEAMKSAEDVERAMAAAHAAGDRDLELDARMERFWVGVQTTWDIDLTEVEAIAALAAGLGRWDRAMEMTRMQANLLLPDDVAGSLARTERLVELCDAHGITEGLAWADYHRAEALFQRGDWDEATAAADRAIALAEHHAYDRAGLRTWFLRLPMAWHRDEGDVLEHARRWFAERAANFPDSPYSRVVRGGIDVVLTWAGLDDVPAPSADHVRGGLEEGTQHPSWYLAVDLLFRRWIGLGRFDDARAGLEILEGSAHLRPFAFEPCFRSLERASLRLSEGDRSTDAVDAARAAADALRGLDATYWLGRSLATLGTAGAADPSDRDELAVVARRLGSVRPLA